MIEHGRFENLDTLNAYIKKYDIDDTDIITIQYTPESGWPYHLIYRTKV